MIEYIDYIIVSYCWNGLEWCTSFLFIYFWLCWVYFELWYWRRLLRVSWTARWSNQSILKEISLWKDWCWSWNSNTLATWCEEHFIGKDPDAGKDWRQEEKGTTEDEMVGWHHWLYWHKFEQTQRDSEGQGSLVCCSPRGHKEADTTELLNNKNFVPLMYCLEKHSFGGFMKCAL